MFITKFVFFFFFVCLFGQSLAYHFGGPGNFLGAVSPSAFFQFQQFCESTNMTKSEVLSQLTNWAQTNGVSTEFANATRRLELRQQELQSLANANLVGSALQLFNQLYNLLTNNSITRLAECQGIRSASNATDNNQREIRRLVPVPPSAIPCTFYPPQCFANVVPFAMPRRDMAEPDVEVTFVQVPENIQPAPIQQNESDI